MSAAHEPCHNRGHEYAENAASGKIPTSAIHLEGPPPQSPAKIPTTTAVIGSKTNVTSRDISRVTDRKPGYLFWAAIGCSAKSLTMWPKGVTCRATLPSTVDTMRLKRMLPTTRKKFFI